MNVWGITGGIGMGKSVAGQLLEQRQVYVIDTDRLARQLTEPGASALVEIRAQFGSEVISDDGRLDRARLAEIVFGDARARQCLESILHPRIAQEWRSLLAQWRAEGRAQAAVLIPLLYERGYESEFCAVVAVACTSETQRQRLRARGLTESQIDARNAAQMPINEKLTRAKFAVWTEGSFKVHGQQWDRILATPTS